MAKLTIDLNWVEVDLLETTDSPVLREAIQEAAAPPSSAGDGAGFNNKM